MEKPRPESGQPEFKPAIDASELMGQSEAQKSRELHYQNAEQLFSETLGVMEGESHFIGSYDRGVVVEIGVRLGRIDDVKRIIESQPVYSRYDVDKFVDLAIDRGYIDLAQIALKKVEEKEGELDPKSPYYDMNRAGSFRAKVQIARATGEKELLENELQAIEAGGAGHRTAENFARVCLELGEFDRAWSLASQANYPALTEWIVRKAVDQNRVEWAKEATLSIGDERYRALAQAAVAAKTGSPEDIEVAHQDIELVGQVEKDKGRFGLRALCRLAESGDVSALAEARMQAEAAKDKNEKLTALSMVYRIADGQTARDILQEMWDSSGDKKWVLQRAIEKGDTAFAWNMIEQSDFGSDYMDVTLELAEKGHPHAVEALRLVSQDLVSKVDKFKEREKRGAVFTLLNGFRDPSIGLGEDLVRLVKIIDRYEGLESARRVVVEGPDIPRRYRLYAALAEAELEKSEAH